METDNECHIIKLPSEVLNTILQYTEIEDTVAFGATCKYYNAFLQECKILWKTKFKDLITEEIFHLLRNEFHEENWYDLIQEFYVIRQRVYREILAMSPKHFWQENSLTLQDVKRFFSIALNGKKHYHYTIHLLQDLVSNGVKNMAHWEARPPYTLTEMHYAKVVLSHVMHSFLAVKWAQRYKSDKMLPYAVLTFFIQWMNIVKQYNQDDVDEAIDQLVRDVEVQLLNEQFDDFEPGTEVKRRITEGMLREQDVLGAISEVVYRQKNIVVTPTLDLDSLNIMEVLKKKSGHMIAVASVYHAIANKCGVVCHVTAFTDHFILEWTHRELGQEPRIRKINLENGELQPKRRCPFYNENWDNDYSYSPNSFLRYLVTTFTDTVEMGHLGYNNWYRQNAFLLYELINPDAGHGSTYYNYFRYLSHDMPQHSLSPISVKDMQNDPLQILLELTSLNTPDIPSRPNRSMIVRKRDSQVRYAVGMICCHVKYLYACIIVDWDPVCDPSWMHHPDIATLEFGYNQPFYKVVAADESNRYIPQEKLSFVANPQRMTYLEDYISREFTHFNGFVYVPNKEKMMEYPEDWQISEMFLSRVEKRIGISLADPFSRECL